MFEFKLKQRKSLCLVQGHSVNKWQNCGYGPCCLQMILSILAILGEMGRILNYIIKRYIK